jgi:hypothetical protein
VLQKKKGGLAMRRSVWVHLFVLLVCLAFVLPAFAAEEKAKEDKVTGTIVSVPADPSGKLAPIAIKTEKETLAVINNAISKKKMEPHVGQKAKLTGIIKEMNGKKVMEVWIFERVDESGKKPKLKQPTG